jgi:hypothetical protein
MRAIGNIDRRLLPYLNLNESTYAKLKKEVLGLIASSLTK